jgi:hypothetical protein
MIEQTFFVDAISVALSFSLSSDCLLDDEDVPATTGFFTLALFFVFDFFSLFEEVSFDFDDDDDEKKSRQATV